jgi:hypothetical protein
MSLATSVRSDTPGSPTSTHMANADRCYLARMTGMFQPVVVAATGNPPEVEMRGIDVRLKDTPGAQVAVLHLSMVLRSCGGGHERQVAACDVPWRKGDIMDRIIAALLLLAAIPASAQTIHKCADAKGGLVYQSHPCEDGKSAGKQWVTEHRNETSEEAYQRRIAEQKIERDRQALRARNASGPSPRPVQSGTSVSQYADASRCEAAKRQRAQTLEAVGLRRTYDLIARLDNAVQAACK